MEALTFCWQWQQGSWSRGNWIIILMTRRTACAALDWSFLTCALLCPEVTCSLQTKKLGEMNLYMVSLFNSSPFNSKYLHISCRKVWIPWLKDQSTIGTLNCWGRTVLEGGQILNSTLNNMTGYATWRNYPTSSWLECTYYISFILVMGSNALCQKKQRQSSKVSLLDLRLRC